MVVLFLNCGMRLAELVRMDLGDIDLEQRQIRLFGKGHKERMVYLNDACIEALQLYLKSGTRWTVWTPRKRPFCDPPHERPHLEPPCGTAGDRCHEGGRAEGLFDP